MQRSHHGKDAGIEPGECSRERIEVTLGTILASDPFRTSPQCRELLQYILRHTVASEHDLLKERVIGANVFGRKANYDTASDPIVRVRAADVRKRLAQFYQSEACLAGMPKIEIPVGGYHATFRLIHDTNSRAGAPVQLENSLEDRVEAPVKPHSWPPVHQSRARSRTLHLAILSVGLTTVAGLLWVLLQQRQHWAFEEFWAPAFTSAKAITIYNADSPAYRLRWRIGATQNDDPRVLGFFGADDKVLFKQGEKVEASELIPIQNQFITIGDGYATALLCGLFARHEKAYQLKFGTEMSFVDLRYAPAVLIGAFNNGWTLETTKELKFNFSQYPSVQERGGQNRVWTLAHLGPDGETPDDYAIVSRIFNANSGQLLIAAAGVTQYGTRAAGEFLTTPEELEDALRHAPSGWKKRNIQFVIHTQIVRETPGRPTVVASYFW
jgi:hypothetical protein